MHCMCRFGSSTGSPLPCLFPSRSAFSRLQLFGAPVGPADRRLGTSACECGPDRTLLQGRDFRVVHTLLSGISWICGGSSACLKIRLNPMYYLHSRKRNLRLLQLHLEGCCVWYHAASKQFGQFSKRRRNRPWTFLLAKRIKRIDALVALVCRWSVERLRTLNAMNPLVTSLMVWVAQSRGVCREDGLGVGVWDEFWHSWEVAVWSLKYTQNDCQTDLEMLAASLKSKVISYI